VCNVIPAVLLPESTIWNITDSRKRPRKRDVAKSTLHAGMTKEKIYDKN